MDNGKKAYISKRECRVHGYLCPQRATKLKLLRGLVRLQFRLRSNLNLFTFEFYSSNFFFFFTLVRCWLVSLNPAFRVTYFMAVGNFYSYIFGISSVCDGRYFLWHSSGFFFFYSGMKFNANEFTL